MSNSPRAQPSRAPRGHWLSRRLGRRIVALFLGLLLVVQALTFLVTRESIDRNARADIARNLEVGEKIFRRLLAQHAQRQSDGASLLAADQVFRDLQEMSGLKAGLLVRPAPGGPWTLVADTLDGVTARALTTALGSSVEPATYTLRLAGQEFVARRLVLDPNEGGNMQAVLLRAVDEVVAPYEELQLSLAVLTLAGVAVFAAGSVLTARHVTTPILALVRAADRLGRGDYETPVDVRTADEIGELAQAFDRMRRNVDAQKSQIALLAYWDQLTGLPNRTQFRDAVRDAIAQAASSPMLDTDPDETPVSDVSSPLAVLMLDLDRFKSVNDVLGYEVGDRLLLQVAERLARVALRPDDMVARLGGDEFAVLLPETDAVQALQVAERMAAIFEESLAIDEHAVDLGISIGVAIHPDHAGDADALHEPRRGGHVHRQAPHHRRDALRPRLRCQQRPHAVDARRPAARGRPWRAAPVPAAPRLAAQRTPGRRRSPAALGPSAAGPAAADGVHPVRRADRLHPHAHLLGDRGEPAHLAAAARPGTDADDVDQPVHPRPDGPGPAAEARALLDAQSVPAQALCLEITESAIMDDPQRAQQTLERLSEIGFRLAIDDFGTGYSSLAYLKRLPVNELKIDKSFVMQMARDSGDAKIVRSTIDLAHNLGLKVVAEGVETATAWRTLGRLACDEAQGHLIGRPMPPAEFSDWAERWRLRDAVALCAAPDTMTGTMQ